MDLSEPITEIIESGQAFSSLIVLERILWVLMGFFFIGAIANSIIREIKLQNWFENISFLPNLKADKRKGKPPIKLFGDK